MEVRAVYIHTFNASGFGKWYDWRDDPNSKCKGYILEIEPAISFALVDGDGDGNNSLFSIDQNGTLRTASLLDYEAGEYLTIRVQAKNEHNATLKKPSLSWLVMYEYNRPNHVVELWPIWK